MKSWPRHYVGKMMSTEPARVPQRLARVDVLLAFLATFVGIGGTSMILTEINEVVVDEIHRMEPFITVGALAAFSTLAYAMSAAPVVQPRVFTGAFTLSICVGLFIAGLFPTDRLLSLQYGLCGGMSIALMAATGYLHPPAGAASVAIVLAHTHGRESAVELACVVASIVLGVATCFASALVFNNLSPTRRYPTFW